MPALRMLRIHRSRGFAMPALRTLRVRRSRGFAVYSGDDNALPVNKFTQSVSSPLCMAQLNGFSEGYRTPFGWL